MLHLDLKPANIMRKGNEDLVLIDFGLSKQFNSNGNPETSTKIGLGTPGYAPIEQANFRKEDYSTLPATLDIYALGGTMFKMITGKNPTDASAILNDGFPYEKRAPFNWSHSMIHGLDEVYYRNYNRPYPLIPLKAVSFLTNHIYSTIRQDDPDPPVDSGSFMVRMRIISCKKIMIIS